MIEIRPLDLRDPATLDAVVTLQRESYAVEAEILGTGSLPPMHETPADVAASGESFLGAFDGGLAGIVSWKREGADVDIHRLAVAPREFRRGIGRRLLTALLEAHPDAERWTVATGEANAPARALYESAGFRRTGGRVVPGGVAILEFTRP